MGRVAKAKQSAALIFEKTNIFEPGLEANERGLQARCTVTIRCQSRIDADVTESVTDFPNSKEGRITGLWGQLTPCIAGGEEISSEECWN